MKLKNIFVTLIFVLLLVTIIGCKKEVTKSVESFEPETGEEEVLSSSEHVQSLLDEKKITVQDAALIELMLTYSPEDLSQNIKPKEEIIPNVMWAENYILNNWDSFTEEEKNKLLPFYVFPDDPISIHYSEDSKIKAIAEAISIIPSVVAAGNPFSVKTFKLDSSRTSSVYYKNSIAGSAQQADWIGASFLASHKVHEALLGLKPKNDIKIYLVDMGAYGSAVMKDDNGVSKCTINVRRGLDKKNTEATVAHELFHCFQFAIPLKYEKKDMMWLMEATATWSEHNVYPSHNSEWEYHKGFFSNLGGNMLYYGENREYSTYMWILFLSQKSGNKVVKDLIMSAKSSGATNAVMSITDYNKLFKEYGVYSWNQNIAHKFSDTPEFPVKFSDGTEKKPISKKSYYKFNANKGTEQDLGLKFSVFSNYYHHIIIDSTVKKIKFEMDPVPDSKHPIQALIKTKEGWYYEDFEGEKEKKYCITDDSKIEEIILITTNSQKESFKPKIMLSTKGECEPEWTGYYKVTWTAEKIDTTQGPRGSAKITNYVKAEYISHETLKYDEEKGNFDIISAQVSYESTSKKHIDYSGDCERYEYEDGIMSGTYNYDFSDSAFPPLRMSFEYGDTITGPLSFDFNPVTKQGIKWIHYTEKKSVLPCDNGIGEAPSPKITTFENDYDDTTLPPEEEELLIDANPGDKEIKGKKTIKISSDQYGEYEALVEYDYAFE